MKRLVIEQNSWLEAPDSQLLTVNGVPTPVSSITFDNIGSTIENPPSHLFTKGPAISGRLTNVASFED